MRRKYENPEIGNWDNSYRARRARKVDYSCNSDFRSMDECITTSKDKIFCPHCGKEIKK